MRGAQLPTTIRDGRTARRTATRSAILTAATTLFAGKGVTGTSIDEIAEKAGTAKGSVFYNFGSKSGLVSELFDSYAELLQRSIGLAAKERSGRDLRTAVVHSLLLVLQENTDAAQVIVSELFRTDRDWADSVSRWRDVATEPIVADIVARQGEQARNRGHIFAAAIVGATLTAGLEWLAFTPETPLEKIEAALLEVLDLDA